MAITTYAQLESAVSDWLARAGDAALVARIPDFVMLFEGHFNRVVRVRRMVTTATLTPDANGEATVPTDFLEFTRLTWLGSTRRSLEYVSPDYFQAYNPVRASDTPRFFTIEGATIKVNPLSTTNVDLSYYQKVPALTGAANWLLTQHPDVYLAGTLAEANAFSKNPEIASLWLQRRDGMMADIIALDAAAKGPSAVKVMDSPTP